MTEVGAGLFVKSHVARDLLQSAALFRNEHLVVWEYVSNGLQYVDPGVSPEVRVRLDDKGKKIAIADNGRGMAWGDLQNFFVMHGENSDRKAGRPGRGRFGTGKSAAFGIAGRLEVTTVRSGKRSRVSLDRSDIDAMGNESPISVMMHEQEVPTTEANGTKIVISEVHLRRLDQKRVITFVEQQISHWPRDVVVWVNNHQCQ
ncbi:MAG: ATP-binding protein, partial [Myxococcota bacterium]